MKCCTCKQDKPVSEFGKNKSRSTGLQARCLACVRVGVQKWYQTKTPEMTARLNKRGRRWQVLKKYGLSPEEYARLQKEHNGRCAVCGEEECKKSKLGKTHELTVDHDHTTGKVRALLCHRCNVAIGLCKENPDLFRRIIDYLK